jgi:Phytanoyl-CoA dioxygenase (PhyH)
MDRGTLDRDGVVICRAVLSDDALATLRPRFASCSARPGARGFNPTDSISDVIDAAGPMGSLAAVAADGRVRPARILFFDKTPESNWAVPWHQDRSIAVNKKADVDGYGPWTVKNGVDHVEPPAAILEKMLTSRLFVDDCGSDNGALLVAVGSHRHGRLPVQNVAEFVSRSEIFVGAGRAGDVLLMKTLAIHSSKRAAVPTHRRVLHVDYATADLPPPL